MYQKQSAYTQCSAVKSLKDLQGQLVQLNLGGPESGKGKLVKIGLDFCALESEKEIHYYQLHHIKSFTLLLSNEEDENTEDNKQGKSANKNDESKKNSKQSKSNKKNSENKKEKQSKSNNKDKDSKENKKAPILYGRTFTQIIDCLRGEEIQINRGGPQKVIGVLEGRDQQYMILTVNKDIVLIPIFHVQNISWKF